MVQNSIITLARHRLKALKFYVATYKEDLAAVINTFHQLTGLTSIRFVENHGLDESISQELALLDSIAILTIKNKCPYLISALSDEAQRLSLYHDMAAEELLDIIFKQGGRFNNQEAITVARHRGLLDKLSNEAVAYSRVKQR